MNKLLLSFVFSLSVLMVSAQGEHSHLSAFPGGKCFLYRVVLRDKAETGFSTDHPEAFLSPRALERRRRQRIAVDSTDLPVSQKYIDAVATKGVSVVGKSKWNNSLLVRCDRPALMARVEKLPFVTEVKLVFSSPKQYESSVRASFRKEFQAWDTLQHHPYGITRDQIGSLNGIRLHDAGYRGRGMVIAVLDAGFMNVDRIPAFHGLKLVGLHDFVVPRSTNIFQEMEHGTKVLSVMAVDQPDVYVGSAPQAPTCCCAVRPSRPKVCRKKTSGAKRLSLPTRPVWTSSIRHWAIMPMTTRRQVTAMPTSRGTRHSSPAWLRCWPAKESCW